MRIFAGIIGIAGTPEEPTKKNTTKRNIKPLIYGRLDMTSPHV